MTHILAWLRLLNIFSITWNIANLCVAAVTTKRRGSKIWGAREKERREVWRTVIVSFDVDSTCSVGKHVSGVLRHRVRRRRLFLLCLSKVIKQKWEMLSAERARTESLCRSYLLHLTMWQSWTTSGWSLVFLCPSSEFDFVSETQKHEAQRWETMTQQRFTADSLIIDESLTFVDR